MKQDRLLAVPAIAVPVRNESVTNNQGESKVMKSGKSCTAFGQASASLLAAGILATGLASAALAEEPDRLMGLIEPATATKPLTIGVTLVHLQDDYWKGMAYGISDEAKRSGVIVRQIDIAGGYGNVPQQFSQINTMVSKGIDTLIVAPAAYDGFDTVLKDLKSQGIHVITAGVPVNSTSVDFGIVQNDSDIGAALTDAVCKDKGTAPAKALVIQGPAGAEWARLRIDAIQAAAAKCKGLELVVGPVGKEISLAYGMSQTSDMLLTNPDAKYVMTIETSLGLGATQAVKAAGSSAKVVTSALDKRAVDEIQNGDILVAVTTEPGILIGRLLVQYAIRQNEGMDLTGLGALAGFGYPVVIVPAAIFSKATIANHPAELYDIPPEDWSLEAIQ